MNTACSLLLHALHSPDSTTSFQLREWDLLVRQARRAGLLGRIATLLNHEELLSRIHTQVAAHLASELVVAGAHDRTVRREVGRVHEILKKSGVPIVLLKGAAYVMAGLPPARGRLFSDIDIMVPIEKLEVAEQALLGQGWARMRLDAYDQRYYRQWTHELPPLRHIQRHTVLDVHHGILPKTARLRPDSRKLLAAARPLDGLDGLMILAPPDMVLHSATHLFEEGEFGKGLRDLVDLDDLLRHFSRAGLFWSELLDRAEELGLTRPLFYALRYTQRFLDTPVPMDVQEKANVGKPRGIPPALMDSIFARALAPNHPSCNTSLTRFARFFLYVRGHYLRMPLHLLIPHLIRKAIKRRFSSPETRQANRLAG
jgi:hypothetical protein